MKQPVNVPVASGLFHSVNGQVVGDTLMNTSTSRTEVNIVPWSKPHSADAVVQPDGYFIGKPDV